MKLIDLENPVMFSAWQAPDHNRYLRAEDGSDATTFLWWQCVAMAYFWNNKIDANPREGETSKIQILKNILWHGSNGPKWLMALRANAKERVTPEEVATTLACLKNVFKKGCSRKRVGSA